MMSRSILFSWKETNIKISQFFFLLAIESLQLPKWNDPIRARPCWWRMNKSMTSNRKWFENMIKSHLEMTSALFSWNWCFRRKHHLLFRTKYKQWLTSPVNLVCECEYNFWRSKVLSLKNINECELQQKKKHYIYHFWTECTFTEFIRFFLVMWETDQNKICSETS